MMAKIGKFLFKALPVPGRVPLGPEEFPPHVVIEAIDLPSLATKECY
jgi:hypothetical protein